MAIRDKILDRVCEDMFPSKKSDVKSLEKKIPTLEDFRNGFMEELTKEFENNLDGKEFFSFVIVMKDDFYLQLDSSMYGTLFKARNEQEILLTFIKWCLDKGIDSIKKIIFPYYCNILSVENYTVQDYIKYLVSSINDGEESFILPTCKIIEEYSL